MGLETSAAFDHCESQCAMLYHPLLGNILFPCTAIEHKVDGDSLHDRPGRSQTLLPEVSVFSDGKRSRRIWGQNLPGTSRQKVVPSFLKGA